MRLPRSAGLLLVLLAGACAPPAAPLQETGWSVPGLLGDGAAAAGFARVTGPRPLVFPRDHGPHPAYRNEWWYVTGVVRDRRGRRFGFQYTLFRLALEPGDGDGGWASRQLYMAHVAVTHEAAGEHRFVERLSRAGPGLAGATAEPFSAWLHDWRLQGVDGAFLPQRLDAAADNFALAVTLSPGGPMVLQGDAGYSRKGRDPGNASRYYSYTRLPVSGWLQWDGEAVEVDGTAWLDREWGSSVLDADVEGWDWLALRLADGRDLMLYRLRRHDGTASPWSAGTLVDSSGGARSLAAGEFTLQPLEHWTSPVTGIRYPVAWRARVPEAGIDLTVTAALPAQEMRTRVRYWEGLVDARHTADGAPAGEGYLELAGY